MFCQDAVLSAQSDQGHHHHPPESREAAEAQRRVPAEADRESWPAQPSGGRNEDTDQTPPGLLILFKEQSHRSSLKQISSK